MAHCLAPSSLHTHIPLQYLPFRLFRSSLSQFFSYFSLIDTPFLLFYNNKNYTEFMPYLWVQFASTSFLIHDRDHKIKGKEAATIKNK